jgi:DNA-binding MarR family transcriptional regulator
MAKSDPNDLGGSGRFDYKGRLDDLLHEKARLSIVTSLATHPGGLVFSDLKELCALTDGNLSRHLYLLNDKGIVEITKGFLNNRPQTLCKLTAEGRRRFLDYISALESVVTDALDAARGASAEEPPLKQGWSPA